MNTHKYVRICTVLYIYSTCCTYAYVGTYVCTNIIKGTHAHCLICTINEHGGDFK